MICWPRCVIITPSNGIVIDGAASPSFDYSLMVPLGCPLFFIVEPFLAESASYLINFSSSSWTSASLNLSRLFCSLNLTESYVSNCVWLLTFFFSRLTHFSSQSLSLISSSLVIRLALDSYSVEVSRLIRAPPSDSSIEICYFSFSMTKSLSSRELSLFASSPIKYLRSFSFFFRYLITASWYFFSFYLIALSVSSSILLISASSCC